MLKDAVGGFELRQGERRVKPVTVDDKNLARLNVPQVVASIKSKPRSRKQ
jgi:hypothetical protein